MFYFAAFGLHTGSEFLESVIVDGEDLECSADFRVCHFLAGLRESSGTAQRPVGGWRLIVNADKRRLQRCMQ